MSASEKKRLYADISADLDEELRNAVVFLQRGPDPGASLRRVVEDAVRKHLAHLRRRHKDEFTGDRFPQRTTSPRVGRPLT